MKNGLHIGETQAGAKVVVPEDVVVRTIAMLAMKGRGKTHGAMVLAEEMSLMGLPWAALDPTGAWWGIRSSASGTDVGFPVTVLGGEHGDLPLEPTAGKLVADLLVDNDLTVICDLKLMNKSAMKRFAGDFLTRIYERNRTARHLFVDEADLFAPQKPWKDDLRMLGAMEDIVRRGRTRGLGCSMLTQRAAVLNKDVLSQAELLVALGMVSPQDRAALKAWVDNNQDRDPRPMMESLASLKRGEAWLWSPGWLEVFERITFRAKRTFDSSATPKVGVRAKTPRLLADVDLDALRASMQSTIEEAEAKDPAKLRARIAELEKKLAAGPGPAKERVVEVPAFTKGELDRLEAVVAKMDAVRDRIAQSQQVLVSEMGILRAEVAQARQRVEQASGPVYAIEVSASKAHLAALNQMARGAGTAPKTNGSSVIPKGERAVLVAIAQHDQGVTREQVTVLTGYKRSTRDAYIQRLVGADLVRLNGDGTLSVSPVGVSALGPTFEPLPTGDALLEHWLRRLPIGERGVLAVAVSAYPKAIERDQVTEETGYKRSTRDAYIQRLATRRLLEVSARGITASALLFDRNP